MITRRTAIQVTGSLPFLRQAFAWSHDDFWNSKDRAQWSDKETNQLLTHSPWAKQVSAQSDTQPTGESMGAPGPGGSMGHGGGMGGMGGNGGNMGGGGGMGGGRNRGGMGSEQAPEMRATVRWESALPLSAALKKSPPPEAAESYVVSVTGLRVRPHSDGAAEQDTSESQAETQRRMLRATTLEVRGKDPISPSTADQTESVDGPVWRFTFPRKENPIVAEDKEVTLAMHLGRAELKAKFALKDMLYKGQLAL